MPGRTPGRGRMPCGHHHSPVEPVRDQDVLGWISRSGCVFGLPGRISQTGSPSALSLLATS
eukprot:70556-Alexandrium_andersonii.AAC.1